MIINSLELTNFRNHKKTRIKFTPITILVGPNGIGKTNLLEAINIFSAGRSWRTNKDGELINWSSNFARLRAQLPEEKIDLFLSAEKRIKKLIKINNIKKKTIDLLGLMPAVLFLPEHLEIISGPPFLRRRFLNGLLVQVNRDYALNLILLQRVLKRRNALLNNIKINKTEELSFWDQKLVKAGSFIIEERKKAIEFLNNLLASYYSIISKQSRDKLRIKYYSTVPDIKRYLDLLVSQREKEIKNQISLYGPHRDDIKIFLNNREVRPFISRGEIRSIVLAFKKAEMDFIRNKIKKEPLLLLDDIFSELDAFRRQNLLSILDPQQMILTTTDLDELPPEIKNKAKIVQLSRKKKAYEKNRSNNTSSD